MTIKFGAIVFGLAAWSPLVAQSVGLPAGSKTAGHAVSAAGTAAQVVPAAHEVPAAVLNGTVPGSRPFASGVTQAGKDVAGGVSKTGSNLSNRGAVTTAASAGAAKAPSDVVGGANKSVSNVRQTGPSVKPTGALSPNSQGLAAAGIKNTVVHIRATKKGVIDPKCNEQSADFPECLGD
jgi:hypothetical protein